MPAPAVSLLLALPLLAVRLPAAAQAPAWQSVRAVAVATQAATDNFSAVRATAIDAAGNVYLAGEFRNTVVLGGTVLTSLGDFDIFVAKFNPVSNQFVWAQRAGGTSGEGATALAVSGSSVYVTGEFVSPTAGFGPATLTNAGGPNSPDLFVAKLTDAGSTSSFVWAQRAGGPGIEDAYALAVNGSSVYVAGAFSSSSISFGATTRASANSDVFVAKLTDAGSTGSFVWAQRAGGADYDRATALAVSGASVYVAGEFVSPTASFGATTLTNAGTGNEDVFVAKLTDAGSTSSFAWAQRAGGTDQDNVRALATGGTSVYIAGSFKSPTASFGAATLASASSDDVFVAKLTDAGSMGSLTWAQRAGGSDDDYATAIAVSGSSVYVAGNFYSPTASFGATTLNRAGADVFVAKLTDAGNTGSFVWAQKDGGAGFVNASALAVNSTDVFVAGDFEGATATFGTAAVSNPYPNPGYSLGFLASLTDVAVTATTAAQPLATAQISPNPAHRTATLHWPAGTAAAPFTLTDAQGRTVRRYPAPAGSATVLDLRGLPAGLYLLHGAGQAQRLMVE